MSLLRIPLVLRKVRSSSASCWEALEFSVDASEVRAVYEDVPFMHIAHDAAQVFWAPPSAKLESQSLQRDK